MVFTTIRYDGFTSEHGEISHKMNKICIIAGNIMTGIIQTLIDQVHHNVQNE